MSCNSPVTKNSVDLVERAQWALHVQRKAILICIFTTKKSNHAPTTPRPCTKAGGGRYELDCSSTKKTFCVYLTAVELIRIFSSNILWI